MPPEAPADVLYAAAGHTDFRLSSQPQQGVTTGPLGGYVEGNSSAVAGSRMHTKQGSGRNSVQSAINIFLSKEKDVNAEQHRGTAVMPVPVQEPATLSKGPVRHIAGQIDASSPNRSAQKASGSEPQAKRTKSRPSFVEGF